MKVVLMLLLMFSFSQIYTNPMEQLYRAIEKIDYGNDLFSYESRIVTKEKESVDVQVVLYSPLNEPRYSLLSKNGLEPNKKDYKVFWKQREREGDDKRTSDILGDEFTLEVIEDNIAMFSFVTTKDMIPEKESKMSGRIWINLDSSEIDRIELINRAPIKIFVGVSIKEFYLDFKFEPFSERYTVVKEMDLRIKGKAVMVDFNQRSNSLLYNYDIVGVDGDI